MVASIIPAHHHAVDEQRVEDVQDRCLISATDVGRRGEGAANPAPKLAVELDALVQELLERPGHRPIVGGGPEDKAVVAKEIADCRLPYFFQVDLKALRPQDIGDPDGHLFRVVGNRIVTNQRLGHEYFSYGLRMVFRNPGEKQVFPCKIVFSSLSIFGQPMQIWAEAEWARSIRRLTSVRRVQYIYLVCGSSGATR